MNTPDFLERPRSGHNEDLYKKHFPNAFVFKTEAKNYPIEYIIRVLMTWKNQSLGFAPRGGLYMIRSRSNPGYIICYTPFVNNKRRDVWWITKPDFRVRRGAVNRRDMWRDIWQEATYYEVREFIEEELKTL